jgi:hypothetical protein
VHSHAPVSHPSAPQCFALIDPSDSGFCRRDELVNILCAQVREAPFEAFSNRHYALFVADIAPLPPQTSSMTPQDVDAMIKEFEVRVPSHAASMVT